MSYIRKLPKGQADRDQPPPAVGRDLDDGRGVFLIEGVPVEPDQAPEATVYGVPWKKGKANPTHGKPQSGGPVHGSMSKPGGQRGNDFTSLSHLDNSRLRSADEPYLAKS